MPVWDQSTRSQYCYQVAEALTCSNICILQNWNHVNNPSYDPNRNLIVTYVPSSFVEYELYVKLEKYSYFLYQFFMKYPISIWRMYFARDEIFMKWPKIECPHYTLGYSRFIVFNKRRIRAFIKKYRQGMYLEIKFKHFWNDFFSGNFMEKIWHLEFLGMTLTLTVNFKIHCTRKSTS